jgi:hypothetical protein
VLTPDRASRNSRLWTVWVAVTARTFVSVWGLPSRRRKLQLAPCTCSFCRSHNPRMISDPEGLLEVQADDWSLVERYQFGTRTCDFLICRRCGVFIAAVAEMAGGVRAVVNVNCLNDRARFIAAPTMHEFQRETIDSRLSRRAANWMPAIVALTG